MLQELVKQTSPLPAGIKLMILGAGFSGQCLAKAAKALGANVLCSRRDLQKTGADFVFNSADESLPPRKYLEDGSSSHILGYVSEVSVEDLENSSLLREINVPGLKTGKNGLEKSLNEGMIGQPGLQRFEVNAHGKRIKELKFIQGTPGKNYRTTLDIEVQKYAGELLKEKSGSICIMDIYTGDLVAMVSSPTFDANKFVHGIASKDWQDLINNEKKPLIN